MCGFEVRASCSLASVDLHVHVAHSGKVNLGGGDDGGGGGSGGGGGGGGVVCTCVCDNEIGKKILQLFDKTHQDFPCQT